MWDSVNFGEERCRVAVASTICLCRLPCGMRAERACVCVSPHRVRADPGPPGPSPLLAEALLEQAMIGPSPNPLILSYLKYAISSQVMTLPTCCLPAPRCGRCWVSPRSPSEQVGEETGLWSRWRADAPNLPSVPPLGSGGRWRAQCVPEAGLFLEIASACRWAARGAEIHAFREPLRLL